MTLLLYYTNLPGLVSDSATNDSKKGKVSLNKGFEVWEKIEARQQQQGLFHPTLSHRCLTLLPTYLEEVQMIHGFRKFK